MGWIWLVLLLAGGCFIGGCNTTTTVRVSPLDIISDGGQTSIAVDRITGPYGLTVSRYVVSALREDSAFVLTDSDSARLILSGRVDGEIKDIPGRDYVKSRKDTGRTKPVTRKDVFIDKEFTADRPVRETAMGYKAFTVRKAYLKLTYRLEEVSGKGNQGDRTVSVTRDDKYGGINQNQGNGRNLGDLPTKEKTLGEMSEELTAKLMRSITGQAYILDKGLGFWGEPPIVDGVVSAQKGQWQEAVKAWLAVVETDPDHPAANYNLGIAQERKGDLESLQKARQHYVTAAKNGNKHIYRQALTRVTKSIRENGGSLERSTNWLEQDQ